MAKRYHDKDGMNARVGRADSGRQSAGYYERPAMLYNDNSAPSNCPTEVILKDYPDMDYLSQTGYPDSLEQGDMIQDGAVKGTAKQKSRSKY